MTMNSHFDLIKQHVSIADACRAYGIKLNRHGKALCPFHTEKDMSFSVKGNIWSCFGCGKKGDVIKLVELLFNLSPIEALARLNADFHVGLDLDYKPGREVIIKYRQDQELKQQFEKWTKETMDKLILYFRELHYASLDPKSPIFEEALIYKATIDYYIEYLENDPLSFYKANRGMVKRIEHRRNTRGVCAV